MKNIGIVLMLTTDTCGEQFTGNNIILEVLCRDMKNIGIVLTYGVILYAVLQTLSNFSSSPSSICFAPNSVTFDAHMP